MLKSAICLRNWCLTKTFNFPTVNVDPDLQKFQAMKKKDRKIWKNAYLIKLEAGCTLQSPIAIPCKNGGQDANRSSDIYATTRGTNESIKQSIKVEIWKNIYFFQIWSIFAQIGQKSPQKAHYFKKKFWRGCVPLR